MKQQKQQMLQIMQSNISIVSHISSFSSLLSFRHLQSNINFHIRLLRRGRIFKKRKRKQTYFTTETIFQFPFEETTRIQNAKPKLGNNILEGRERVIPTVALLLPFSPTILQSQFAFSSSSCSNHNVNFPKS